MRIIKKTFELSVIVVLLLWALSPLFGEEPEPLLKGKVHYFDKEDISLAKKFDLARKEFRKSETGDAYFTGYVFLCRHEIHMGGRHYSPDLYKVTTKNNDIKLRRPSRWKRKDGEYFSTEDGSEPAGIIFLHRISKKKGEIVDARIIDLDHTYEFEDAPIYWFGDADNEESFRFLKGIFDSRDSDTQKTLIYIISSHDTPKSHDFLRGVAVGNYEYKLKKSAVFWLGNYKDQKSLKYLKEIYNRENSTDLKKQIVFAIQLSDKKDAVTELIKIAKTESSRKVRKNAIFWLGQKASKECVKALKDVIEESDDIKVKESAVFAISQLPCEKAVPLLIEIAKSNKSPSIRKKAIFWLGQKDSEEALKFFEEILIKK